jgi:hypothetical protein
VTAEDIAKRHGEKTEQYHDPRGPSVPQDAADDDERDERCDRGSVSRPDQVQQKVGSPHSAGLLSTLRSFLSIKHYRVANFHMNAVQ